MKWLLEDIKDPPPSPPSKKVLPKHVCGLMGYNDMIDPPCPACEYDRIKWEKRKSKKENQWTI